jgi:hypothetical protein
MLGVPNGLFVLTDPAWSAHATQSSPWRPRGVALIAGNNVDDAGFEDGSGISARFSCPSGMTVDARRGRPHRGCGLRKPRPAPRVQGRRGYHAGRQRGGQGEAARFNHPQRLARDKDGIILVVDRGNNAVRRVTMEVEVRTVAGNGEAGMPTAYVVVDKEGRILLSIGLTGPSSTSH